MNKIINFHAIHNAEWFEQILKILKKEHNFIKIEDLESYYYEGKKLKNACHVTIDDGDNAFYETMYPVLKKMKVPATLFVSPKMCSEKKNFWFQEIQNLKTSDFKIFLSEYLDIEIKYLKTYSLFDVLKNLKIEEISQLIEDFKTKFDIDDLKPQNLSIEKLIEIDRDGLVSIGAHTNNHPILANENDEKSKNEIIDSIMELEKLVAHEINYFAFPNGMSDLDFGKREIETLKSINCKLAFSTELDNFLKSDNPLAIPRIGFSFGNKYFIHSKLLLGKYWELGKKLTGNSEKDLRIKLKQILSNRQLS